MASALILISVALASRGADTPSTYKIMHQFQLPKEPIGNLTMDAAGNLYGTTYKGGTTFCQGLGVGCGFVWKLAPNGLVNLLLQFAGGNGGYPNAGLVSDAGGNLYGTTGGGGSYTACTTGCGVVFKLVPNPDGTWTERLLHRFTGGADGAFPASNLIFDSIGNLYGTTVNGGAKNEGTVFKLAANPDGTWTESVLHSFTGSDGAGPAAALTLDAAGNLYGTTNQGGGSVACTNGCGTVFKLAANPDGTWTESVLHSFAGGAGGAAPYSSLIFDGTGNIYGTTYQGGCPACTNGCGVIFKLVPNADGTWTESVLHSFTGGADGSSPPVGVVFGAAGSLYGTGATGGSTGGGACTVGCGVVFKLTPTASGWSETVVRSFLGVARFPLAPVIFDPKGNLYGTTSSGTTNNGVVFEITR